MALASRALLTVAGIALFAYCLSILQLRKRVGSAKHLPGPRGMIAPSPQAEAEDYTGKPLVGNLLDIPQKHSWFQVLSSLRCTLLRSKIP